MFFYKNGFENQLKRKTTRERVRCRVGAIKTKLLNEFLHSESQESITWDNNCIKMVPKRPTECKKEPAGLSREPKGNQKGTKGRQRKLKGNQQGAKGRQRETKGSQNGIKGYQREAKGRERAAKGRQKGAKGRQKGTKGEPNGNQKASKRWLGRWGRFLMSKGGSTI